LIHGWQFRLDPKVNPDIECDNNKCEFKSLVELNGHQMITCILQISKDGPEKKCTIKNDLGIRTSSVTFNGIVIDNSKLIIYRI